MAVTSSLQNLVLFTFKLGRFDRNINKKQIDFSCYENVSIGFNTIRSLAAGKEREREREKIARIEEKLLRG